MSKKKQKAHKNGHHEKKQNHSVKQSESGNLRPSFPDLVRHRPAHVAFGLVLILLLVADLTVHKHEYIALGNIPGFYAVYGFLSAAVLVLAAKALRVLSGQKEDKKR